MLHSQLALLLGVSQYATSYEVRNNRRDRRIDTNEYNDLTAVALSPIVSPRCYCTFFLFGY
jgi:hypothetical protein